MRDGNWVAIVIGLAAGIALVLSIAYATTSAPPSTSLGKYNQTLLAFSRKTDSFVPVALSAQLCQAPSIFRNASANFSSSNYLPLKDRVWISVRPSMVDYELNLIHGKCTIENNDTLSSYSDVLAAIQGTDRCISEQDICYRGGMIGAPLSFYMYSVSVTPERAMDIARYFDIHYSGTYKYPYGPTVESFRPSTIVYYDRLYQLYLHTAATDKVGVEAVGNIVHQGPYTAHFTVLPGHTLNATMTFKIYSTYGGPATMNLSAWIPVSDSGLNVTFSHSHLVVQERSQVNTTIVIIANPDAKPGIYRVNLADTLNNNVNNSDSGATGCYVTTVFSSYDGCLDVTVAGNGSDWFISNTSGSGVEYGGRFAPPWFSASVETDKDVYRQGEPIKLSVHITNNGNRTLTLPVRDSDVIIHFYDRAVSFPVAFHPPSVQIPIIFEIRANGASNSNQTIVLAPHSSKLLVREFVWDQKTYDVDYVRNYVTNIKNVPPGKYYLVAELDLPNVGGVEFTQKAITVSS